MYDRQYTANRNLHGRELLSQVDLMFTQTACAVGTSPESFFFRAPPITPSAEMGAYEALWLNEGAWFKNIADLFRQNPGAVPSELVDKRDIARTLERLRALHGDKLETVGIQVHGANEYPSKLRDADHPPEVLYYLGDWQLLESPAVAIVGTRVPSAEGVSNAARIAHALAREDFTVVSGLAKGIDTAAHRAAIAAGGRTVGVIGTPIFSAYPKENVDLQMEIARDHLLISQVPFLRYEQQHYKMNSLFFPARNITMSALTLATVIVEAGNTSGTLIQARAALAQGRKLFILDSCFRDPALKWPAKFELQGAVRVRSVGEILKALSAAKDRGAGNDAPARD